MERNERKQLAINNNEAMPVLSSMRVPLLKCMTLIEVSTIKQNPSRLVDVLSICGDLLPLAICPELKQKRYVKLLFLRGCTESYKEILIIQGAVGRWKRPADRSSARRYFKG